MNPVSIHYQAMALLKSPLKTRMGYVYRGGSRISGKGVHMIVGVGVHFADFISFLCCM